MSEFLASILFFGVAYKFPAPLLAFFGGLFIDLLLGTKMGITSVLLLLGQLGLFTYGKFARLRLRVRVVFAVIFWLIYFHVLWRHLF